MLDAKETWTQKERIEYFECIYNDYKQKVYNTARFLIKDSKLAEDIMQEVFIKIFINFDSLRSVDKLSSWIYRITYNHSMNYISRNKKIKMETGFEDQEFTLHSKIYVPEELVLEEEFAKEILGIVSLLPQKHYQTVILFYYLGMGISEIANTMKCLQGTVKSRLFYSRAFLKKELEDCRTQIGE